MYGFGPLNPSSSANRIALRVLFVMRAAGYGSGWARSEKSVACRRCGGELVEDSSAESTSSCEGRRPSRRGSFRDEKWRSVPKRTYLPWGPRETTTRSRGCWVGCCSGLGSGLGVAENRGVRRRRCWEDGVGLCSGVCGGGVCARGLCCWRWYLGVVRGS